MRKRRNPRQYPRKLPADAKLIEAAGVLINLPRYGFSADIYLDSQGQVWYAKPGTREVIDITKKIKENLKKSGRLKKQPEKRTKKNPSRLRRCSAKTKTGMRCKHQVKKYKRCSCHRR